MGGLTEGECFADRRVPEAPHDARQVVDLYWGTGAWKTRSGRRRGAGGRCVGEKERRVLARNQGQTATKISMRDEGTGPTATVLWLAGAKKFEGARLNAAAELGNDKRHVRQPNRK